MMHRTLHLPLTLALLLPTLASAELADRLEGRDCGEPCLVLERLFMETYFYVPCATEDNDGDFVPVVTFCAYKFEPHLSGEQCSSTAAFGVTEILNDLDTCVGDVDSYPEYPWYVGDDRDDQPDYPVPWGDVAALPNALLSLLNWATAEAGQTLDEAYAALVAAVNQGVDDAFPVTFEYYQVEGPYNRDGDALYTARVSRCTGQVTQAGQFIAGSCDAPQEVGDPDDADPTYPVDPAGLQGDVVELVNALNGVIQGLIASLGGLADETVQAVQGAAYGQFPISYPWISGEASDRDQDGVWRFHWSSTTCHVGADGATTCDPYGAEVGNVGDPDDADPENPLVAPQIDIDDWDEDGASGWAELQAGSNPWHATSKPEYDDDGDGTSNQAEALPVVGFRGVCGGAYGLVASPECSGYATPLGCAAPMTAGHCVDGAFRFWVFDPVCTWAALGDYATCRGSSTYGASGLFYSGAWADDGYGWRYAANVPALTPQTITVVTACGVADADGDLVPRYGLCDQSYTIYPNGNVQWGDPTPRGETFGDPDDADPNAPIPHDEVDRLLGDAWAARDEVLALASGLLGDAPSVVNQLINDAIAFALGTAGDAEQELNELLGMVPGYVGSLQELADELAQEAERAAQAATCAEDATVAYGTRLMAQAANVSADPSDAQVQRLKADLTVGSSALLVALDACAGNGVVAFLETVWRETLEAAMAFLETVGEALGAPEEAVGKVEEFLGTQAQVVGALVNETLAVASGLAGSVEDLLRDLPPLLIGLAESYLEQDWTEPLQTVYKMVYGEGSAGAYAYLVFLAVDSDGEPVAAATVVVARGGYAEASGETDAEGEYRASVPAEGTYTWRVVAEGYAKAEGEAVAPGPGLTTEIPVRLERGAHASSFEVLGVSAPTLLWVALLLVAVVVVWRRRR